MRRNKLKHMSPVQIAASDGQAVVLTWDESVTYHDIAMRRFSRTFYGKSKNYRRIYLSD